MHIEARRISNNMCFAIVIGFLAGCLAETGLNLVAQLSDKIGAMQAAGGHTLSTTAT